MQSSNSSEFGSEDEDAEFALYAKLYFEPNEDVPDTTVAASPPKERASSDAVASVSVVQETVMQKIQDGPELHNELTIKAETRKNTSRLQAGRGSSEIFPKDAALPPRSSGYEKGVKDRSVKVKPSAKRERQSSVCSVESISGKVPLDGLYCTTGIMDLLQEEEEEDDDDVEILPQKGSIKIGNRKDIYNKKRKIAVESSDEEDSRCRNLEHLSNDKGKNRFKRLEVQSNLREDSENKGKFKKKRKVDIICLDDSDSSDDCISLHNVICNVKETGANESQIQNGSRISQSLVAANKSSVPQSGKVMVLTGLDKASDGHLQNLETIGISSSESDVDDLRGVSTKAKLIVNFDNEKSGFAFNFNLNASVNREREDYLMKQRTPTVELDFTKRRPSSKRVPSCSNWTPEMTSFYDSDESDYFDVEEVHRQQSGLRGDWKILSNDYAICRRNRYYNAEPRCSQCRQFGHTRADCPRVPHCFLCSETDHIYRRDCPSNCCLRCGGSVHNYCYSTTDTTICHLCGGRGHVSKVCPDLWRRFHLTTSGSVPVQPTSRRDSRSNVTRKYCCSCGRRGHYGFECLYRPNTRYAYAIQGQFIFTYDNPIHVNSGFPEQKHTATKTSKQKLNMETVTNKSGCMAEVPEKVPDKVIEKVQKVYVTPSQISWIFGTEGAIINSISEDTEAVIRLMGNDGDKNRYIQISGNKKPRIIAHGIIQNLLGHGLWHPQATERFWRSVRSDRKKESVQIKLKRKLKFYRGLWRKLPELPDAVVILREGQRMNGGTMSSSPEFLSQLQGSLMLTSLLLVGHLKQGGGQNLIDHVTEHLNKIEQFKRKESVPTDILKDISSTFNKIDNPGSGQLDQLLHLAETYLQSPEKPSSESEFRINLKSKRAGAENRENHNRFDGVQEDAGLEMENSRRVKGVLDDAGLEVEESMKSSENIALCSNISPLWKCMMNNRNKSKILGCIRRKLRSYRRMRKKLPHLYAAVNVLRQGQGMDGGINSGTPEFTKKFKRSFEFVSALVIGYKKYGEGKYIFKEITQLSQKIRKLKRQQNVPEPDIRSVFSEFEKIDSPSLHQLDEILNLAETCLQTLECQPNKRKNDNGNSLQKCNQPEDDDDNEDFFEEISGTQKDKEKAKAVVCGKEKVAKNIKSENMNKKDTDDTLECVSAERKCEELNRVKKKARRKKLKKGLENSVKAIELPASKKAKSRKRKRNPLAKTFIKQKSVEGDRGHDGETDDIIEIMEINSKSRELGNESGCCQRLSHVTKVASVTPKKKKLGREKKIRKCVELGKEEGNKDTDELEKKIKCKPIKIRDCRLRNAKVKQNLKDKSESTNKKNTVSCRIVPAVKKKTNDFEKRKLRPKRMRCLTEKAVANL